MMKNMIFVTFQLNDFVVIFVIIQTYGTIGAVCFDLAPGFGLLLFQKFFYFSRFALRSLNSSLETPVGDVDYQQHYYQQDLSVPCKELEKCFLPSLIIVWMNIMNRE